MAEIKCPDCGSLHVVKSGSRVVRSGERKQRWMCKDCAKTFYHEEAES